MGRYIEPLSGTGGTERIDHRSHAARGLDEQPTIHKGVTAQALELKVQVKKLIQAVKKGRSNGIFAGEDDYFPLSDASHPIWQRIYL